LELFLQLLNQRWEFFLTFRFDLLPERLFHFSTFLNVAGFKLSAFLWIQAETGLTKGRFGLTVDHLAAQILSLAHNVAFLRTHPHPTLGVTLEILPGFRRKCLPPLTCALAWRWPVMRSGRQSANRSMGLRLRMRGSAG
jgi:hypothetical protein